MPDLPEPAEVIPIGTSGRPGRGSGRSRPSAAARDLAGGRRTTRKAAPEPARDATPAPPPEPAPGPETPATRHRPAVTTTDRHPLAGIPVSAWLSAFQHAAVEVFGEDWERRLAELMAFLRRRLSGEYVVDEYGFDAEVTERFFMAALRPRVVRSWSPTTPAPSPWTG